MKTITYCIAAAVPLATLVLATPAGGAPAQPCPDVQVVFARGTMEPPGLGRAGQAFVDALTARAAGRTVDVAPVNYPASLDFATAADGVVDAANRVQSTASVCPTTKIVLGGYSQGAAVAAYITEDAVPAGVTLPLGITGPMPAFVADHVAAVVLFGKPSSGFLQMVYTGAPPITVGSRYVSKTLDLCIADDPVCAAGGGDNAAHTEYPDNGMADQAAQFAMSKLGYSAAQTRIEQAAPR
jgi:cutinase